MAKKNRKKKALYLDQAVMPTHERLHHNAGLVVETLSDQNAFKTRVKRYRATSECVLDYYLKHEKMNAIEYEAALLFRKHYLRAVLHVRVGESGSGNHGDYEIGMINLLASEQQLKAAYDVLSPAQKALIIRVCGYDEWVGDSYKFKTFYRALEQLIKLWRLS
ncbi:MAG: hypothetical protein WAO98_06660 [Alphaproteobacteria bacterium]